MPLNIIDIQKLLNDLSNWSVVLPLFIGIVYGKYLTRDSFIVLGIVALAAIPQLLNVFASHKLIKNIAYNLYTPFEYYLFYLLFKNKVHADLLKKIFNGLTIFYIVLSILFILFINIEKTFISEWVCANNFIYTAWILLIIIEEYQTDKKLITTDAPFFWFLLGTFLYSPCTLLIFSVWNYLKKNPDSVLNNLWIIHHLFNITMYVLFAIGFIKAKKRLSLKVAGSK